VAQNWRDDPEAEAVIDEHGNGVIPADQIPGRPPAGTHLRVHVEPFGISRRSVEGLLPDLPEVSWEQFKAASRLAAQDAEAGHGPS
jgi:hypothetical protein